MELTASVKFQFTLIFKQGVSVYPTFRPNQINISQLEYLIFSIVKEKREKGTPEN